MNIPICLAPMVGLTHAPLRGIIRQYLSPDVKTLWPTEMLNSRKIPNEDVYNNDWTCKFDGEDGLFPQILGNDPLCISKTFSVLEEWGAQGFDINMGCPVKKALKHNYGVALMGDPDYAAEVVSYARASTSKPISVKLRAGIQNDFEYLEKFVDKIFTAGADWVTLHPRTSAQKRRGVADWTQVKKVKDRFFEKAIIGNGDIQNTEEVFKRLEQTGCDAVMVGRGLAAKPWMMAQVAQSFGFDPKISLPMCPEEEAIHYGRCLMQFIKFCESFFQEKEAFKRVKFYIRMTHWWLDHGHTLIKICGQSKTCRDIYDKSEEFFKLPLKMYGNTLLAD